MSRYEDAAALQYAYKCDKRDEVGIENLKNAWHRIYRYTHHGEEFNEQDFLRTWNTLESDFDYKTVTNEIRTAHDRINSENGISNDRTVEDFIDASQRAYAALLNMSFGPTESSNALFWSTYECRKVLNYAKAIGLAMRHFENPNTIIGELKFIPDDISGFCNPSDEEFEAIIVGLKRLDTKINMGSQLTDADKEIWKSAMCYWRKVNSIDDATFKEKWTEVVRVSDSASTIQNEYLFAQMREVQKCRKMSISKVPKLNVEEISMTFSLIELFLKNPISEVDRVENDYFYSKLMV